MHTLTIWRITSLFFSGTLFQPRCERGANIPSRANVPRKEDNVAASFPIGKPEAFNETGMRMPLGMVHNFRHSVEPRGRLPIWKGGIRNLIKLCTYLSGITHKLNQHCSWIAQITVTGCDNEIKKCPDSRLIVKPNNKRELRPSQSALYHRIIKPHASYVGLGKPSTNTHVSNSTCYVRPVQVNKILFTRNKFGEDIVSRVQPLAASHAVLVCKGARHLE